MNDKKCIFIFNVFPISTDPVQNVCNPLDLATTMHDAQS